MARMWKVLCVIPVLALLGGAAGQAEIKMTVRPDGTKFIYNERPEHRETRSALRLRPVPDSEIGERILETATGHGLDPRLIQSVMQAESGYNPFAVSRKGAMGLMQLMPDTARMLEVEDPFDVDQNIRGGTAYLRQLLDRFEGRFDLALAAYNAGPETVIRFGGIPPYRETREYVRRVLVLWRGEATVENPPSPNDIRIVRDRDNRLLVTNESPPDR